MEITEFDIMLAKKTLVKYVKSDDAKMRSAATQILRNKTKLHDFAKRQKVRREQQKKESFWTKFLRILALKRC